METMATAEIQARLIEWQRIASDSSVSADMRRTARRAVKLHRAALASR